MMSGYRALCYTSQCLSWYFLETTAKVEQMYDIMNPVEIKVALLAGGSSSERKISLASGDGAQEALLEAGFNVERLDPAQQDDLKRLIDGGFDVAFLCMHGRGGEDGALQGFLETIGLPYTGSGVFASAVCMDKTAAKLVYEAVGIPTPPSAVVKKADGFDIVDVLAAVGFASEGVVGAGASSASPASIVNTTASARAVDDADADVADATEVDAADSGVVRACKCAVKAASEGSSVGVYIEEGAEAIAGAIEKAFEFDDTVLIERYVSGIELTVVVLGNDDVKALPIIEIVPKNASYDFEAKYAPGGSEHICPARIGEKETAEIQQYAMRAHKALGCSGVSRTDFLLDGEGHPWALETNTLPGMTKTSLLPDAARVAGISFPELCTGFIQNTLERAGER